MNEDPPHVSAAPAVNASARVPPLRVWPALTLAFLMLACRFGPLLREGFGVEYWFVPNLFPLLGSLLMLIWWLAASRAKARERWLGLLGLILGLAVILALDHPSMRSMIVTYLTLPLGMIALALGAWMHRRDALGSRLPRILLWSLAGFAGSLFVRSNGMTGAYVYDLPWRWTPERIEQDWSAHKPDAAAKTAGSQAEAALMKAEWPAFRGADRSGQVHGPKLDTDWATHPPKLLWKKPVGPGWSSFAVATPFIFTQEQRGSNEAVVCYDAGTGAEQWAYQNESRLDDPMAGPGPRATPTLAAGKVFAVESTGSLVCLEAASGKLVWKQDIAKVAARGVPMWGFACSPLVVDSKVIVFAGGANDKGVLAFDSGSGELRWSAACGADTYGSPQLSTILGDPMVLLLTNDDLVFLDPSTGKTRLDYVWKFANARTLQPAMISADTVLLPSAPSEGSRAIKLTKTGDQLAAEELWTSRNLKPDFTDVLIHNGYAYGIDGALLTCVDLKTGQRTWKDGRYGKGQAILLESTNVLLISAENGRVVLVKADPAAYAEIASFQAIHGKTWNHPVVVGDRLYVRNAEEAACYALPLQQPQ